jgi:hypothetical protein
VYVGNGVRVAGTVVGVGTGLGLSVAAAVSTGSLTRRANVGAGVSVGTDDAINLLSPPELLRANKRPTANIAAITPMTVRIASQSDVLILVSITLIALPFRSAYPSSLKILQHHYNAIGE